MAIKTSTNEKQIIVIDKNGNLKLMTSGEAVLPGDVVLEKDSGEVSVNRDDLPKDNNNEIKDILDAIVDGKDPSLVSESPAAGEESGSSLTTSTEIERVGKSTIAETDFDTASLEALGLSKTQSLTLLDQYKSFRETGSFDVSGINSEVIKFAPSISITEMDSNGVINGINAVDGIQVDVILPLGTENGDRLELRDSAGNIVNKYLITENDIINGKIELTVSVSDDGTHEFIADITDISGQPGPESNKTAFELDTSAEAGTVTVSTITEDEVINAAESG
ncbi:hypothetical protein, partial [Aliivibrio logei]|uniref:hypothetical protein n=1 Tax=Aliivibrio logei TaxID=688 RepID=UPI000474D97E